MDEDVAYRLRSRERRAAMDKPVAVKDRGVYTILGLLLGGLGIHSFYVERFAVGALQLVLGILNVVLLMGGSEAAIVTSGGLVLWLLYDLVCNQP